MVAKGDLLKSEVQKTEHIVVVAIKNTKQTVAKPLLHKAFQLHTIENAIERVLIEIESLLILLQCLPIFFCFRLICPLKAKHYLLIDAILSNTTFRIRYFSLMFFSFDFSIHLSDDR